MGQKKNICFIGHSGAGKSTLVTALLRKSGIKEDIVLDSSDEEKAHGYSIDMGIGACTWNGEKITMLDTPGGDEFIEEMYKAIPVADLSVLTVNGEKGIEVTTERAWELSGGKQLPTIVFVNHMDKENANFDDLVSSLRNQLEGKFIPIQIPIRQEKEFVGVVDVIANRALYFDDESKKTVPTDLQKDVSELRNYLIEEIASIDDELMLKFLEDEEISVSELSAGLRKGVADGAVTPILCGAASQDKGIRPLMDALVDLAPGTKENKEGPCSAIVFNLSTDPYLGRLNYVRILQGILKEGETYYDISRKEKIEIRDLHTFDGTKQLPATRGESGEIVAIGKLEDLRVGTTIASEKDTVPFLLADFPKPVYSRTIVPKSQADVGKMSSAVRELTTSKVTLRLERDAVTKEMILWGMGSIQLSVFISRLKNRFNVSLDTRRPAIPYKETITRKATAKYRHKKQSGGRGQFGEVELRIEPTQRGKGFEFLDEIKGASIPGQYIPGVEKGVVEAMEEGNLAKYPVTDVLVAVYDGSFHPVDSSELAFRLAARNAFREAMDQAQPCLLEPLMSLEVRIPDEYTGDVISDLNGRRGKILGMEPVGRATLVRAEVPLIDSQSYALDLKSISQGRATFQMQFLKYHQVPANLQEKIISKSKETE
ncbi:elongation factor G [Candidatus Bipolaricaulota bacterium]|nr:elongation factor G [Candidatus Bipolaricaulota bacterium]